MNITAWVIQKIQRENSEAIASSFSFTSNFHVDTAEKCTLVDSRASQVFMFFQMGILLIKVSILRH